MTERPKILIVTSNPSGITAGWIRERFEQEKQILEVQVTTWDEVKEPEPGIFDLMIADELADKEVFSLGDDDRKRRGKGERKRNKGERYGKGSGY